jgi:hypothetical protein
MLQLRLATARSMVYDCDSTNPSEGTAGVSYSALTVVR